MQFDLFADEALPSIPGLIYQADFLTPEEEKGLLEIIATLPLMPARYKEYESKVRILSFGGLNDFNTHTVKPSPALDARLVPLRNRVADWLKIEHGAISHLLVTEYLPGTQLGWHRDVPVYETIVGISLGNPATIRFRPWPPDVLTSRRKVSLEVMPRSIYKLDGEARWGWQHAVPPVKYPRWSITLRVNRAKPGR
ncbi:alpha-ketoglutarate-dependent dioxygenase AlkB [Klebsiella pneumoniae]|jgi:alkylated DNA repair dioxygenase AlkB|uniref:alpha-ketoglutarate-dependent dioxygenase AlkB n=1 Tax=Klebsiella pneumoniae TaxID=573 RepID=UPI000B412EC2|nr:alpha-ketoglutarate-dependent dioxygenase AlkB [Klebsiella pneumoniae]EIV9516021.1 2OG-Fe(II) oxygenase [Klebsiella pneumoniae]EKC7831447.1 alpha-ketoglutarate-dependent dioxygenase AlkB [Klebsiella pneumoniae]EKC8264267.1 alpha-ketoglutarate-dependent dioxygenase AlkB [Klebsiella pneumoniae]EKW5899684.1 alpha-ketoglutarate-dependent dioxygenase AlkB [Klebsiella pneumoniae]EKZ6556414.1 alpha-ketoglutarate-dependent dioxygenase AlkB [Klebsiella pneumoniae]